MRTLLLLALLTATAFGRPFIPDTLDVPVDKLLAKLEQQAAKAPKDAHLQYLLGRVNAIAYAQNVATFQVAKNDPDKPWFGPLDPGYPPDRVVAKGARKRLEQALAHYRKAVELDPKDGVARMGLAWCLEESGDRAQAITQYRKVYAEAKPEGHVFGPGIRQEAGQRLVALLDPKKDAAEIAELKKEIARLEAQPRAVTPVLIPLERGAAFESLVDPGARVRFDLDGSGRKLAWGWTTAKAGWLVYKEPHNGLQLFGNVTWWVFWRDGYEAMAALDSDGDGWLRGPELDGISVWCDEDRDGTAQADELKTLPALGIEGLSCQGQPHPDGFPYCPNGVRYTDGTEGPSYDWMPEGRP